jgi:hypothetical protein
MEQDFIIEDVESDEEIQLNIHENNESNDYEYEFGIGNDLVQEQNEVIRPSPAVQYRPLPTFSNNKFTNTNQNNPPIVQQQKQPPKKVSYDDILKSMNMRVNNGKLELLQKSQSNQNPQNMYNSYFNDGYNNQPQHQQQQQPEMQRRQLTPQEQRAIMIRRQIEMENQRRRISQIKSKKLLFSDNNIHFSGGIPRSGMNHLSGVFLIFYLFCFFCFSYIAFFVFRHIQATLDFPQLLLIF